MPLTVSMVAVVEFLHTFDDAALEAGPGGAEPADHAMQALVIRLENVLRAEFNPRRVELEADPEVGSEDDQITDISWRPQPC